MIEFEKYIKSIAMDPSKQYVIIVDKRSGISPEELERVKFKNVQFFFIIEDLNAIKIEEKEELKKFLYE